MPALLITPLLKDAADPPHEQVVMALARTGAPDSGRAVPADKPKQKTTLNHANLKLLALLRGGETAGFVQALSQRLTCETAALRAALNTPSSVPLALSLCAVGVDRAVFPQALRDWQAGLAETLRPVPVTTPLILSIFELSPALAGQKLKALLPAVTTAH
ncbi:MAG: hypothetical protein WBQ60_02605 [Asticcacaulis sp.]